MKQRATNSAALLLALGLFLIPCALQADEAQRVGAALEEDRLVVYVNGEEFTAYKFGAEHKYPFFYPVIGPATGESVTAWDQAPYPHHSSLYISLDWVRSAGVERGNYWQPRHELETGQVFSRKPRIIEATGDRVVLQDECDWIVPEHDAHQLRDTRTITISAPSPHIRLLDFQFDFEVLEDLRVGPTGHSFFSVRMRPELAPGDEQRGPEQAPLGTGTIVDSAGNVNEDEARGHTGAWWSAMFGQHHGATEGVAIVQHPDNPLAPAPWFNRNYGFLSPTPFDFMDEPRALEKGMKYTMRYRTIVFVGTPDDADVAGLAERWMTEK